MAAKGMPESYHANLSTAESSRGIFMSKHLTPGAAWAGHCPTEHGEDFAVVRGAVLTATKHKLFHLSLRGKLNVSNNKRLLCATPPWCSLERQSVP